MLLKFPDGKIVNIKEDTLEVGDLVGDWQYKGNTTKPGSAIWDEWKNVKTGESSIKTYTPETVTCKEDHNYKYIDKNFNFQCLRCGVGGRALPHQTKIVEGKLINIGTK